MGCIGAGPAPTGCVLGDFDYSVDNQIPQDEASCVGLSAWIFSPASVSEIADGVCAIEDLPDGICRSEAARDVLVISDDV